MYFLCIKIYFIVSGVYLENGNYYFNLNDLF